MTEPTPTYIGSDDGPTFAMAATAVWGQGPFVKERGDDVILWSCLDCHALVADWKGHTRWHERI